MTKLQGPKENRLKWKFNKGKKGNQGNRNEVKEYKGAERKIFEMEDRQRRNNIILNGVSKEENKTMGYN